MKRCLIVVDFQVDFVSGALGFSGAERLDSIIAAKIRDYATHGHDVYFTLDTHKSSYLTTFEGKRLPKEHCIKGTPGHRLYGKVGELANIALKTFEKDTFPSLDMAIHFRNYTYDEVELCGSVSHICVLSNAVMVKSALPNARIFIDQKATLSYDMALHEQALAILRGLQIDVVEGN